MLEHVLHGLKENGEGLFDAHTVGNGSIFFTKVHVTADWQMAKIGMKMCMYEFYILYIFPRDICVSARCILGC